MNDQPKDHGTYQLITPPNVLKARVGASLCGYIENLTAPETLSSKVVSAHIDVLRSVIGHAIDGVGGPRRAGSGRKPR